MLTLNLLSWRTFLMATISPESQSFAWYTTPKLPLPMTLVSVYATSWGRSGPAPGVATTVVTLLPSLPAGYIAPPIETNRKKPQCRKRNGNESGETELPLKAESAQGLENRGKLVLLLRKKRKQAKLIVLTIIILKVYNKMQRIALQNVIYILI